jgi:type VI protein secretion system component Hcp
MTSSRRLSLLGSAFLLTSASALAAPGLTLDVEGVEGAVPGRQTIEVQSYSWGASNAAATSSGAMSAGKVNVQDISMTKQVQSSRDAASGLATDRRSAAATTPPATATVPSSLRDVTVAVPEAAAKSFCASGKHIAKATLTARGERVDLDDAVVKACTTQAGVSSVSLRGHQKTGHVTLLK